MRALVYGLGKTGTTAIVHALLAGLPGHALVLEPKSLGAVDLSPPDLLVKSVRANAWRADLAELPRFDKRILVVRHPFDRVISYLLYDPYNGQGFSDDVAANGFVELLRRKSEDPSSVSVRTLIERLSAVNGSDLVTITRQQCERMVALDRQLGETFHRLKYEDFVDGEFEALSRYVGFEVPREVEVRADLQRVARSRKHGDYHRWFLPEDVEWLRDAVAPFAEHFGYGIELDPSIDRTIAPSSAHLYTTRIINDYRARFGLPSFVPGEVNLREEGALFDRALERYRAGALDESERLLLEATAKNPKVAAILLRLAIVRTQAGRLDDATLAAKAAEALEPGSVGVAEQMKRIAVRRRREAGIQGPRKGPRRVG